MTTYIVRIHAHVVGSCLHVVQPRSQGLSSYRPQERTRNQGAVGGGKMKDLGNEDGSLLMGGLEPNITIISVRDLASADHGRIKNSKRPQRNYTAVKRKSMRNALVPGRRPRKFPAPKFN